MQFIHLRRAGTSVLLDLSGEEARIAHWGADLGEHLPDASVLVPAVLNSSFDVPVRPGLLPQASFGWAARPALQGSRVGTGLDFSARLTLESADEYTDAEHASGPRTTATLVHADELAGVSVTSVLALDEQGILTVQHTLTNTGADDYALQSLASILPVPGVATELLDLTGRWCRERHPQRADIRQGTWQRAARHGRTGHDASLLMAAGTPGFSHESGQVWAVHLAWSGNHEEFVDGAGIGQTMIGAAELLSPGEVVLASGETYGAPVLFAAHSTEGLNGLRGRFHEWFRARPHHVGSYSSGDSRPRPVGLNVWEAVYFDHDLKTLQELAVKAASIGVERFVLDDGWFRGRRTDNAGLGDWFVDETIWPDGLGPLISSVNELGLEFGLWFEPEMVNLDSDVARAHPDWIVGPAGGQRDSLTWRQQHVLDLVNPQAWQYIYERLDALLSENNIGYVKWDQNRDELEHGHAGRASTRAQTQAAYRLFDALRVAHPDVEFESCSSGGGRLDLGILERTDRVWASDCNDALERATIQTWTGLVLPPELVGSHVGPTTSHTTGRVHSLAFRAITALFGHFGMEWDIRSLSDAESAELSHAITLYKKWRPVIHTGTSLVADTGHRELQVQGVVAQDKKSALFSATVLATMAAEAPGNVRFPGLDPESIYRVTRALPNPGDASWKVLTTQRQEPLWLAEGAVASGEFLNQAGLPLPVLNPEQALLFEIKAT